MAKGTACRWLNFEYVVPCKLLQMCTDFQLDRFTNNEDNAIKNMVVFAVFN